MELFRLVGTLALQGKEDVNHDLDDVTGKASSSEGRMTDAFKKIGAAVATYFAVDKIVGFGKTVVDTAASFEDGMLKVQSLTEATQEEYNKLSDAALNYGSTTAWTSKDVADAMGYMALAGFDTNEILDSTSGMLSLASASGEDLATVTDILTDSMTGFGDGADQASRYADVLATTQAKSNTTVGDLGEAFTYVSSLAGTYKYSLEDVSAALGTMANAGVKGSMAGTSLSSIITRLGTNTNGARDAIEALGVQFYNEDGTARDLGDVLTELCDATEGMDTAQKAELASTVAGQEAQKGLLAILNQGSDAYTDLKDKLNDCSGAADSMAKNMESGMGGSIRSLQSAWEGFTIKLGQKFEKPVVSGLHVITSFLTDKAIPAIDNISNAVEKGHKIASKVGDWLSDHKTTVEVVAIAVGTLTAAIVAYNAAQAISNASGMANITMLAIYKAMTVASTVAQTVATATTTGLTAATTALGAAMSFLTSPITLVILAIGALIAIGVLLYKNWDQIKDKAGELGDWLHEKWDGIKEKTTETWSNVKESMSKAMDSAHTYVSGKLDAIKQKYEENGGGIRGIVAATMEGIKQYYSIGYDAINALTGGKLDEIKNKMSEKLSAMVDGVKIVVFSIKKFFDFTTDIPHIRLPHFNITPTGWKLDDLLKGKIPSLGIDWYAKAMDDPMVMTKPTAFGYNPATGSIMAGGEKGSEVVSGTNTLMNMIAGAVASQNGDLVAILWKIFDAIMTLDANMGGNMREALEGVGLNVNQREFARLVKVVN